MTSTFFAKTNSKNRNLKKNKSYPVFPNSGLSVIKRGKSKSFKRIIMKLIINVNKYMTYKY